MYSEKLIVNNGDFGKLTTPNSSRSVPGLAVRINIIQRIFNKNIPL